MFKPRCPQLMIIFWTVLLLDCVFIYLSGNDASYNSYRYCSKTLLVPILIAFAALNISTKKQNFKVLLISALVLSWLGDILLLLPGDGYFIPGLISFLLMHVLYCIVFLKIERLTPESIRRLIVVIIGIIVLDALVMKPLLPKLGDLKIPVLAYMVVISFMALLAINTYRNRDIKKIASQYFIPGALLFIASDAMLAYGKFYFKNDSLGIPVMLTYGTAQFLLVRGFVQYLNRS